MVTPTAASGTFDFESGLKLVQKRGEFMDQACSETIGGMAAMIGADENAVRQLADDEDVDLQPMVGKVFMIVVAKTEGGGGRVETVAPPPEK